MLIAAHRAEHADHTRARTAVAKLAEGTDPWGIPVFCLGEFIRVVTHERVFVPPTGSADACTAVERWLESPTCQVLVPGARYVGLLAEAIRESGATGNLVFDAQIVAVCREAGVRSLLTADRDFARFPGFRVLSL